MSVKIFCSCWRKTWFAQVAWASTCRGGKKKSNFKTSVTRCTRQQRTDIEHTNDQQVPRRFTGQFSDAQPHEVAHLRQPHQVPAVHEQQHFVQAPFGVPLDALLVQFGPQLIVHGIPAVLRAPQRDRPERGHQLVVGEARQRGRQRGPERVERRVRQVELPARRVRADPQEVVARPVRRPRPEVLRDQRVELPVRDRGPFLRRVRVDDRVAVRRVVHHHAVCVVVLVVQEQGGRRRRRRRRFAGRVVPQYRGCEERTVGRFAPTGDRAADGRETAENPVHVSLWLPERGRRKPYARKPTDLTASPDATSWRNRADSETTGNPNAKIDRASCTRACAMCALLARLIVTPG